MAHILQQKYTRPLEREYESWIVWGIEEYFRQIGRECKIFAVTPGQERIWPADQRLTFDGKLIGIQMKQAKMAAGNLAYDRLQWTFHNPNGQFDLVKRYDNIFYCLPTFINREYRRQALHHCLFWSPDANETDKNAWYDNSRALTSNNGLNSESRWGRFIEDVMRCEKGLVINDPNDVNGFAAKIRRTMDELDVDVPDDVEEPKDKIVGDWGGFYTLVVQI
jgi:hypothetical protein